MEDHVDAIHCKGTRHGRGEVDMVEGLGVGGNGGFIGCKDGTKGGN